MKVTLNWLKEFAEIDLTPFELAEVLTMGGLEVEAVLPVGAGIKNVVVGQIQSITPHPAAERLWLCQVADYEGPPPSGGGGRTFQVVCGASNIEVGDKVPLALSRARLSDGRDIKSAKFKGVVSEGMLCSEAELGLGDVADAILILDKDAPVGRELSQYLGLPDWTLEIGVTPNRPDCLGVMGVAREVAALTGKTFKKPDVFRLPTLSGELGPPIGELTSVTILDPDLCPRYSARLLLGGTIGTGPDWMRLRLRAAGVRPINNVVDVTNYVMMELGQPLHAFDLDRLNEGRIVVKRAGRPTVFVALDGESRTLEPEMLTICDGAGPVAIAGVMGGYDSEVRETTVNVLLEAANFNPISIRRTSKAIRLSTEASIRFERGVDPHLTVPALDLAGHLIAALLGATVAKGVADCYPGREPLRTIRFRPGRAARVLGLKMDGREMASILSRLELPVRDLNETSESVEVTVPSFRNDIREEADLFEEVARVAGFDKIPVIPFRARGAPKRKGASELLDDRVRETLVCQGFHETVNFSFISRGAAEPFMVGSGLVELKNPLSQEQSVMRPSLLPGLLDAARRNVHRDITDVKIFEVGKGFALRGGEEYGERKLVAALEMGCSERRLWGKREHPAADYYDGLGTVENLLESIGVTGYRCQRASFPYLHPGRAVNIMIGEGRAGVVGEVHPDLLKRYDLTQRVAVLEVDLDELVNYLPEVPRFRALPRFPFTTRDLAVVVDEEIKAEEVRSLIAQVRPEVVDSIELFDVYTGQPVAAGKKSLAFSIVFQAADRTLTDEEVNGILGEMIAVLGRKIGAVVRGKEGSL